MAAAGTLADRRRDQGDRSEQVTPRRARRPVALLTLSCLVAAVLALPLVFLLIEASGAGFGDVLHLIFRPLTWSLLWNTVRLTVAVTVLCAVIGTAGAWCVERTDLPGRRAWAVLLVVPLAIPDFVVSFGWHSLWTWAHGFRGAVIVMTLAVYPLVYLPVAASLRWRTPARRRSRGAWGPAASKHSSGSPSARPRAPSWAAACSLRWSCWPSTARSRSSATRPSPRRSSASSTATASPPPAPYPWCWSCSACSSWPGRACSAAAAGSAGPARWPSV